MLYLNKKRIIGSFLSIIGMLLSIPVIGSFLGNSIIGKIKSITYQSLLGELFCGITFFPIIFPSFLGTVERFLASFLTCSSA
jgi:hypothetical protein